MNSIIFVPIPMSMKSTVLILGAGSDVARALVHTYASKGFDIQLAARSQEVMDPMVSDVQIRYAVNCTAHVFDAENTASHVQFIAQLPVQPDVVICVFGYLGTQEKAMQDWNEASRIIQVNYTGAVSILNVFASIMKAKQQGTLIGISSVAGERGRQSNYIYGSAKAGFTAYLSGLRNDLFHHGVHVLTVKPGFIRTAMTESLPLPTPLTATPQQVADAIYRAHQKKKNVLYVLWMWKYIMCIIRNIPEGIFKKLKM